MNTIEIKTDLSGEELQVLIWELEAFCEGKRLPKPVLRQPHDVSGRSEQFVCECQRHNPYTGIKFDFALRCSDCNKIIQQNNCH